MSNLNRVDLNNIFKNENEGLLISIIGSSGSGKTTVLKHILSTTENIFTHVILIQGAKPANDNVYIDYVWPHDIFFPNPSETIKEFMSRMKNKIKKYMDGVITYNSFIQDQIDSNPNSKLKIIKTLFIFDDCSSQTKCLSDLCDTYRHSKISMIFLIHNDTDIDKTFRSKITYCFMSVKFKPSQIIEHFTTEQKKQLIEATETFIKLNKEHVFLIFETKNADKIEVLDLKPQELENLKDNQMMFYRSSKQRAIIKNLLKELSEELKKTK